MVHRRRTGRHCRTALPALLCFILSGCTVVETGVTNPVPSRPTVAVAPFFNLSSERAVDGRRFAEHYANELQKVPGYEVVPVGVVEQAIEEARLEMNRPGDALKLARMLGVDSIVVGAVTAYSPYYPPRVGMKVVWYSPEDVTFRPGLPIDVIEEESPFKKLTDNLAIPVPGFLVDEQTAEPHCEPELIGEPNTQPFPRSPVGTEPVIRPQSPDSSLRNSSLAGDPEPFMSYSRMFDGADASVSALLRDYVELRGDLRGGGWEAYLLRSDDFLQFCCHRMILEMLTLHGGQARVRTVFKFRKER